ncbi:methyltransferase domain-containing protein [Colwellia sp. Arc7-635]|uniref:fused MFS/spermidine synthase n=1 Tax=Colwellia sp. Arc7-635 TaxID=2497879 RepID=UPI000F84FB85|nr:fused MFS/spermidine synthase [Colwellia sp. Arc7-635]AZQ85148.1 methyltransferase domain-containing protein [Colwellia sp. Arc7-635]
MMLSATQLTQLQGEVIFQQTFDKQILKVFENIHYRWFTLGGSSIQAIMAKDQKHRSILAIPQALLIFLLWRENTQHILNLGLGAGGLERALNHYCAFNITAIEQQPEIIAMAKQFFSLPNNVISIAGSAQSYLAKKAGSFDVILCDVYQNEQSPDALFSKDFYHNISANLNDEGCALISINISSQQQLTTLLATLRSLKFHLALIDFTDYKNILIIISKCPLPDKNKLMIFNQKKLAALEIDFSPYIERIHVIPSTAR